MSVSSAGAPIALYSLQATRSSRHNGQFNYRNVMTEHPLDFTATFLPTNMPFFCVLRYIFLSTQNLASKTDFQQWITVKQVRVANDSEKLTLYQFGKCSISSLPSLVGHFC